MPILKTYLYSDVVRNGSVSAAYPSGFSPDSFDKSGAKACLGSAETSLPVDSYSLSWGASAVTVTSLKDTWTAGVSLFVSVPDVVNGQGEEVRAIVDPVTGGLGIPGVPTVAGFVGADKPSIVYVRDHGYKQICGDATHASMHDLFKKNGLWPYSLTLNTEVSSPLGGNTASPGGSDAITWEQVRALQADGVEITNHTCRHIGSLRRVNTGFSLSYSGANATATAYVSYTNGLDPVLHCVDSSDNTFDLTNASYDTLGELMSAVNALPGWTMKLAPELDGSEWSKYTLGVAVANAKDCKGKSAMFAISGGLLVRYKGSFAKTAQIRIRAQSAIQFMQDGVSVGHYAFNQAASDTIAEVAAAINGTAFGGGNVGDWECYALDNESASSMSFSTGVEATLFTSGGFDSTPWRDCFGQYVYLTVGMPIQQVWSKLLNAAKTTAATNGVVMRNFSDVGGAAPSLMMSGLSDYSNLARATAVENYINPKALPVDVAYAVLGYSADDDSTSVTTASVVATLAALADSPGFVISPFMHHVVPDGSSGQALIASSGGAVNYQSEAKAVATLAKIKELTDARVVNVLTQQGFYEARPMLAPPSNRVFNPRLINTGGSILNLNLDNGIVIPGWETKLLAANVSAASISNGAISVTSTVATSQNFIRQIIYLEPGKTYSVGALVEVLGYTSGSGVGISLQPTPYSAAYEYRNQVSGDGGGFYTDDYISVRSGGIEKLITVPIPERRSGYIRNVLNAWDDDTNKTWNLSTTKHIRLNIAGAGAIEVDCSAGAASTSAVLAWEIASAINAAIKASATYKKYPEYFNVARAENGYLILETPYKSVGDNGSASIVVTTGVTTDATTLIFGTNPNWSDQPIAVSSPSGSHGLHPYRLSVVFNVVGNYRVSQLHVTEVPGIF